MAHSQWVLHIGTQKTGSKALQQVLSDELGRVAGATVYFPQSGRDGRWHEPLHYALEAGDRALLDSAHDEGLAVGADFSILSYEGFFELPLEAVRRAREAIGDAIIVLFLRRQDSLLNSWYNQLIKAHRVTIDEIRDFEGNLTEYHPAFDHWATLEKWATVFGWRSLRPVVYDKSECVVDQFFSQLGLVLDREGLKLPNPNKALDARGASLLRGVKEALGHSPKLLTVIQLLHEYLAADFVDTFQSEECYLFELAVREKVLAHYAASNERVRQRFFPRSPSLFAPIEMRAFQPLNIDEGRNAARVFLARLA